MNPQEPQSRHQLACLADHSRFRIVECLAVGERYASELARDVSLSQSCTTRHLHALERAGLVSCARSGKRVLFRLRLEDPRVDGLIRWVLETEHALRPPVRTGRTGSAETASQGRSTPAPARPAGRMDAKTRSEQAGANETVAPRGSRPQESHLPDEDPPASILPDPGPQTSRRPPDLEDFLL